VSEALLEAMYHLDQHMHEFSPRELAALRFCELMTTDARGVTEEVWAALQAQFDDGEIIELAAVIGVMNDLNRFADALKITLERRRTNGGG
jgi:alkylhydroperoxidase family enzyme